MFAEATQSELWSGVGLDLWHGILFAVPTLVVIAIALVKAWPEKWLDKRFKTQLLAIEAKQAEALESLKHEHVTELEKLRSEIQRLYSRIGKIHEKEFEVLPKAWLYLHEAYGAASTIAVRFREVPSFEKMTTDHLDEFMVSLKFSAADQAEMRSTDDRLGCYNKIRESQNVADAEERQRILNNYLIENYIFMDDELRKAFQAANESILAAVTLYAAGRLCHDSDMVKQSGQKLTELQPKLPEISKVVQNRLRYYEA